MLLPISSVQGMSSYKPPITVNILTPPFFSCQQSYTHNTWGASVQIRQKVPHKRTFLYLEQLILKHNAHKDTINIKEVNEGLDFYFSKRNEAERMLSFLESVVPCKTTRSHELVSMDIHTSKSVYKHSWS